MKMNRLINKNPSFNDIINKGFTIIETLVAISILMICIAGPLVVVNKSLTAALYAKDQTTATYLAQEGIEIIRNMKDNASNLNSNGWDNILLNGSCRDKQTDPCSFFSGYPVNDSNFTRKYYYTVKRNNEEVAVTVVVSWMERSVPNSVSITSNMTNTTF